MSPCSSCCDTEKGKVTPEKQTNKTTATPTQTVLQPQGRSQAYPGQGTFCELTAWTQGQRHGGRQVLFSVNSLDGLNTVKVLK